MYWRVGTKGLNAAVDRLMILYMKKHLQSRKDLKRKDGTLQEFWYSIHKNRIQIKYEGTYYVTLNESNKVNQYAVLLK